MGDKRRGPSKLEKREKRQINETYLVLTIHLEKDLL